jgi:hypothetical protein
MPRLKSHQSKSIGRDFTKRRAPKALACDSRRAWQLKRGNLGEWVGRLARENVLEALLGPRVKACV